MEDDQPTLEELRGVYYDLEARYMNARRLYEVAILEHLAEERNDGLFLEYVRLASDGDVRITFEVDVGEEGEAEVSLESGLNDVVIVDYTTGPEGAPLAEDLVQIIETYLQAIGFPATFEDTIPDLLDGRAIYRFTK